MKHKHDKQYTITFNQTQLRAFNSVRASLSSTERVALERAFCALGTRLSNIINLENPIIFDLQIGDCVKFESSYYKISKFRSCPDCGLIQAFIYKRLPTGHNFGFWQDVQDLDLWKPNNNN